MTDSTSRQITAGPDRHSTGHNSPLAQITPRLRIVLGTVMRLGPGKIELLEAIGRTGSISAGGRALGMSYRRAWLLVDAVNRYFRQPAVLAAAGGAQGGGAQLTDFGKALVEAYRRIEARTHAVIQEELSPFADDFALLDEDLPSADRS